MIIATAFIEDISLGKNNKRVKEPKKPLLGLTTTILAITAFVAAIVGLLSQVAPLTEALKSSWCAIADCKPASTPVRPVPDAKPTDSGSTPVKPVPVARPTDQPEVKAFTHGAFATRDGEGAPSGNISNIKVSIIDNKGKKSDTYVAEWTWSGSGGSQKGSQTVTIDLKSANGATLQALRIPLDRSHCYYSGNNERHQGNVTVAASLITGIVVSVSPVEGRQGRC